MKKQLTGKVLRKKAFAYYKKHLKSLRFAVFNSKFFKLFRKYRKMRKVKLIALALVLFRREIAQRPRIRLISFVFVLLGIMFFVSSQASFFLREKEPEIKVNGHAVLVADQTTVSSELELAPELSSKVIAKRTPFNFRYPVESGVVSQKFTQFHKAFDIATSLGTQIRPLGPGKVEFAGSLADGKGNVVIVNHGDGIKSLYAHIGKIQVGTGDEVNENSVLGMVGLTGRTTGPHVHLEIYDTDVQIDPGDVLPDSDTSFPTT